MQRSIYNKKLFTLELLNSRIADFQRHQSENFNHIQTIKREHLPKGKLKMSASEMIAFSRFFGLIIGGRHDEVKEEENSWYLYRLLRKLVGMLTSPVILKDRIVQIDFLIHDFLSLYKKLFGNLKFKFHNLIHIVQCLKNNGPLINYWTMRYESKHRQLKLTAVSTANRMNLLKTISIKKQLRIAYLKISKKLSSNSIIFHNSCVYENIDETSRRKYFSNDKNEKIISTEHVEVV